MTQNKIQFDYEFYETIDDVIEHIKKCEGHHKQQAVFSAFHTGLTQICFNCKKVRSTLMTL